MREVIVEQATGKVVTDNIDPDYFVDGVEFFRSRFYETMQAAVQSEIVDSITAHEGPSYIENETSLEYVSRYWDLEALADKCISWHQPDRGNGGYFLNVNPDTFWTLVVENERIG